MRLLNPKQLFIGLWLGCALLPLAAQAKDLGVVGHRYPIKEVDLIQRIHQEIKTGRWKAEMTPEKIKYKLFHLKPKDMPSLPRATSDRTWRPDLRFTLDFAITDAQGQEIYPKGFQFDPAPYTKLSSKYVVFNPEDREQLNWYEASGLNDELKVKLLVTGGSFLKLSKKWKRPVYYLPGKVAKRLGIRAVPAIFEQQGQGIRVRELVLPRPQGDKRKGWRRR